MLSSNIKVKSNVAYKNNGTKVLLSQGLLTVHPFRRENTFQNMFLVALELNGSWCVALLASARRVAFRMDCFVVIICAFSAILSVSITDNVGFSF